MKIKNPRDKSMEQSISVRKKEKFRKTIYILFPALVLLLSATFCGSARADYSDGLAGWWKMDETSGTTVADSSGNNNDGTLIGAQHVAGLVGNGLLLDGLTNRVQEFPGAAFKYTGGDMTLSILFKPDANDADGGWIISKPWSGNGEYNYNLRYYREGTPPDYSIANFSMTGATSWNSDNFPIASDAWNHLVITVNGSTREVRIYNNGVLEYSGTHNITNWTPQYGDINSSLCLGEIYPYWPAWPGNSSYAVQGALDDFRVYNRALAPSEIRDLYSSYVGAYDMGSDFLRVYPLQATKNYRITELSYPLPEPQGSSISLKAAPGEFEAASFALRAGSADLGNIQISASALTGPGGATIAANKIDIRLVRTWYQSGVLNVTRNGMRNLLPELLVKDDSLVRTDLNLEKSFLRATVSGSEQYIDVTDPNSPVPAGAIVQDASSLQPFSMPAYSNKQIWLTIHPPDDAVGGNYSGTITISVPGKPDTTISLSLRVLPFSLSKPLLEESIYYRGLLSTSGSLSSEDKNQTQMIAEFKDMYDHGIQYPTIYQPYSASNIGTRLNLMKQVGFPTDKIFELGNTTQKESSETNEEFVGRVRNEITQWKNVAQANDFGQVHMYGTDEATGDALLSQLAAWQAANEAGGKIFVATSVGTADKSVADYLNVPVLAGAHNSEEVNKWHAKGAKVFSYGNPQAGVENTEIYRKNYGLALFAAGYDGTMDYAYQDGYDVWNDFYVKPGAPPEGYIFRPHVFAYPTTNGVIDTIEWEGWREGVDDLRYLATLANRKGWSREEARAWISDVLDENSDPAAARESIIDEINSTPIYTSADINRDESVNLADFNILKNDFLKIAAALVNPRSDIDGDGQATVKDVGILMSGWR